MWVLMKKTLVLCKRRECSEPPSHLFSPSPCFINTVLLTHTIPVWMGATCPRCLCIAMLSAVVAIRITEAQRTDLLFGSRKERSANPCSALVFPNLVFIIISPRSLWGFLFQNTLCCEIPVSSVYLRSTQEYTKVFFHSLKTNFYPVGCSVIPVEQACSGTECLNLGTIGVLKHVILCCGKLPCPLGHLNCMPDLCPLDANMCNFYYKS